MSTHVDQGLKYHHCNEPQCLTTQESQSFPLQPKNDKYIQSITRASGKCLVFRVCTFGAFCFAFHMIQQAMRNLFNSIHFYLCSAKSYPQTCQSTYSHVYLINWPVSMWAFNAPNIHIQQYGQYKEPTEPIQNSFSRLINGTGRRQHIAPISASLHWLPALSGFFLH